jgi:hypothetical protein
MNLKAIAAAAAAAVLLSLPLTAQEDTARISFEAELGTIKVLSHTYRVGAEPANTNFDFVNQGGQEILFPFGRLTAYLTLRDRHQIRFLYQPLELKTEVDFESPVTVDDKTFTDAVRMTYSFPFYRVTYQYRFLSGPSFWLAGGGAIQLRNASIRFEDLSDSTLAVSQNLGIVPALALSGRASLGGGWFAGFEATGIYASSALFNGADFEFEGSILDASLRVGRTVAEGRDIFLNARFFGGSAAGVSQYEREAWSESDSPETENRIASVTLTLGATLR